MCFQMFTDVFHLFPPVTCQSSIILSEQHHSIVTKTYFKITVESTAEYSPTTWKYWLHIFRYYYTCILCSHNTFRLMNVVTLRYAWLVPRWVTIFGRVNHFDAEPGTQAYSASACPLCRLKWVPCESRGLNRHTTWHTSPCMWSRSVRWWLASRDQRQLTGSGSALETCSWSCAIQMAAFYLLFNRISQHCPLACAKDGFYCTYFVFKTQIYLSGGVSGEYLNATTESVMPTS